MAGVNRSLGFHSDRAFWLSSNDVMLWEQLFRGQFLSTDLTTGKLFVVWGCATRLWKSLLWWCLQELCCHPGLLQPFWIEIANKMGIKARFYPHFKFNWFWKKCLWDILHIQLNIHMVFLNFTMIILPLISIFLQWIYPYPAVYNLPSIL